MKVSGKYAIRFPEIRNLECTAYLENEVKWVQSWERQSQSHRISSNISPKPTSRFNDEDVISAQQELNKVEGMLAVIRSITYRQLDIEGCSKYYEEHFDRVENLIVNAASMLKRRREDFEKEHQKLLAEHIEKLESRSRRFLYNKSVLQEKSEQISELQSRIKQTKKVENTASFLLEKCFQTNLELGFNIKDEGLVWILKRIGLPSSYDHFPRFLNSNEKNFLVEKYTNWVRKEALLKEREALILKSHEMNQIETVSPLMNLGKISDSSIKSQRLQASVNEALKQVSMNRERMRVLLLYSVEVKATANELLYSQTSRKIANYFTNRDLSRLNLRRSSFTKRQLEKRRQLQLEIQQVDCRIKSIDAWIKERSDEVLNDIRKEFTTPGGQLNGRLPTTVVGALFGVETACREAGKLSEGLLQLHSPTE